MPQKHILKASEICCLGMASSSVTRREVAHPLRIVATACALAILLSWPCQAMQKFANQLQLRRRPVVFHNEPVWGIGCLKVRQAAVEDADRGLHGVLACGCAQPRKPRSGSHRPHNAGNFIVLGASYARINAPWPSLVAI